MRVCQFDDNRIGVVDKESVREVTAVLGELPAQRYPFPLGDAFIAALPNLRERLLELCDSAPAKLLSNVRLLSPVANPSKVIGAPVNYQKHLDEVAANPNLHHDNKAHIQAIQQSRVVLEGDKLSCRAITRGSDSASRSAHGP